jgi:hypothetical protein
MPEHESERAVQEDQRLGYGSSDSVAPGDSLPNDLSVNQTDVQVPEAIIIPGEGPGTAPPPIQ